MTRVVEPMVREAEGTKVLRLDLSDFPPVHSSEEPRAR